MGISIVYPHAINEENDRVLALNQQLIKENTVGEYEILTLGNMKRPDLVYEGWNYLISKAKYDLVLWHNTDLLLGPKWDVPIRKLSESYDWISLRVVECGAIGVAKTMICKDFGLTAASFRRKEFEDYVEDQFDSWVESEPGWVWYCPSVLKKSKFLDIGGFMTKPKFPNPNDMNFKERAIKAGWKFCISNFSWAYHLQRAAENQGVKPERT